MNAPATIGHNSQDPMDECLVPFTDVMAEAQLWLDGHKVENEQQMNAVDTLIKGMKGARKAVDEARDRETKPLHEAWKGEVARWKPTQDDLDMQVKGLVALVDDFKRILAAEKARIARAAWDKAEAERKAAEALVARADVSDIEAQREAKQAMEAADLARAQASAASNDKVRGMRSVTKYEVTDHRALLNWIAQNARADITAFIDEWARKNHKDNPSADGLKVWQTKEAF